MGVASVKSAYSVARQSRMLVMLQIAQIGVGVISQFILLARWSPHRETDLFLVISGVPWLISAALLISSPEVALPNFYHQNDDPTQFLNTITGWLIIISVLGAFISTALVTIWALRDGMVIEVSLWLGGLLGLQMIPATLLSLWRGQLVALERLISAQLTLLGGGILNVVGYALMPGRPSIALPLITCSAVTLSSTMAWWFCGRPRLNIELHWPPPAEIKSFAQALTGLSTAAGLIHLQGLLERAIVFSLGTGYVGAFNVVGRGYEALMAVIVAGYIMPAYPHWAKNNRVGDNQSRQLLGWSLRRTFLLSFVLAILAGAVAIFLEKGLGGHWKSGEQTAQAIWVLIPRFFLLSSLQPLVLKNFAQGQTWPPVIGSVLGIAVFGIGALTIIPRYELTGMAVIIALSVLPGWVYLSWRELWGSG